MSTAAVSCALGTRQRRRGRSLHLSRSPHLRDPTPHPRTFLPRTSQGAWRSQSRTSPRGRHGSTPRSRSVARLPGGSRLGSWCQPLGLSSMALALATLKQLCQGTRPIRESRREGYPRRGLSAAPADRWWGRQWKPVTQRRFRDYLLFSIIHVRRHHGELRIGCICLPLIAVAGTGDGIRTWSNCRERTPNGLRVKFSPAPKCH